ncbi:MAG: 2Fe-2S iron-sulfur cluster binding domain-containing protein [Fimbriimonadaceae bacterium]|nr:2Fe-2S iron-sulfur cluster binding domain-containing protein [Fimbriimonadaceae bacterium]
MSFLFEGRAIASEDGETVLGALLRLGHPVDHGCKAGACQACLLRAKGPVPKSAQRALDESLVEQGYFLGCQAPATSVEHVVRPDAQLLPRRSATVIDIRAASRDVRIVLMEIDGLAARRGQFIRLVHSSGVVRSYSIADCTYEADRARVELHVRLIAGGQMSELVAATAPGDCFEVEGPLGRCFYRPQSRSKPILLIGSGTGLAPLYGVALDALQHEHASPVRLYHGGATPEQLYFREELSDLGNIEYRPCADEGGDESMAQGSPLEVALRDHPDMSGFTVFLCGHPGLVRAGQKRCFLAGADLQDIFADPFEDQSNRAA